MTETILIPILILIYFFLDAGAKKPKVSEKVRPVIPRGVAKRYFHPEV